MWTTDLGLEPGSNTVTLCVPGDYTVYLPDLAELLSAALGTEVTQAGTKGGLSFWLGGSARPISMRVLPPTPERLRWYQELGSPLGPDPQFVSLSIDWRGDSTRIAWSSDTWMAPKGSRAVRGAANWPDYRTVGEYRSWLGEVATAQVLSDMAGRLDAAAEAAKGAAEAAKGAAGSAGGALLWPVLGAVAIAAALLWARSGDD